jgi:hypothetical protein
MRSGAKQPTAMPQLRSCSAERGPNLSEFSCSLGGCRSKLAPANRRSSDTWLRCRQMRGRARPGNSAGLFDLVAILADGAIN